MSYLDREYATLRDLVRADRQAGLQTGYLNAETIKLLEDEFDDPEEFAQPYLTAARAVLRSETRAARLKNVGKEEVLGQADAPTRPRTRVARARARIPSIPEGEGEEAEGQEGEEDDTYQDEVEVPPPTPMRRAREWGDLVLSPDEGWKPEGRRVRWAPANRSFEKAPARPSRASTKTHNQQSNGITKFGINSKPDDYPNPWTSFSHRNLLSELIVEVKRNGTLRWPEAIQAIKETRDNKKIPGSIQKLSEYSLVRYRAEEALLEKYWVDYMAFRAKLTRGYMCLREELDSHLGEWWRAYRIIAPRDRMRQTHMRSSRWRPAAPSGQEYRRHGWPASSPLGVRSATELRPLYPRGGRLARSARFIDDIPNKAYKGDGKAAYELEGIFDGHTGKLEGVLGVHTGDEGKKKGKKRGTTGQQATGVANSKDEHPPKGSRSKKVTSSMPPSFGRKSKSPIDLIRNTETGSAKRKKGGTK
ncbi:hypothetical protein B0H67DRAFT_608807 [Lasiosphaeris hirsuta]|uniref:Uncharacterized protein n=1 Tax=Lasiosphaeris hirsuta TaxID=260670 RepID=A0AA40AQD2_9PEZI|nr:hypothetical protein B0H67DRAFT_608807 [Lasiosphaeris hirsuta]